MTPTPPDTRNGASDPQGVGQTLHRWLMAAGALMGTGALFPNVILPDERAVDGAPPAADRAAPVVVPRSRARLTRRPTRPAPSGKTPPPSSESGTGSRQNTGLY
ncbi:hypothetical protein WJ968_23315 [Achromobacter xylosoxidans]